LSSTRVSVGGNFSVATGNSNGIVVGSMSGGTLSVAPTSKQNEDDTQPVVSIASSSRPSNHLVPAEQHVNIVCSLPEDARERSGIWAVQWPYGGLLQTNEDGEGPTVEFKSLINCKTCTDAVEGIFHYLPPYSSAFLNSDKFGQIASLVFGVDDNARIIGISDLVFGERDKIGRRFDALMTQMEVPSHYYWSSYIPVTGNPNSQANCFIFIANFKVPPADKIFSTPENITYCRREKSNQKLKPVEIVAQYQLKHLAMTKEVKPAAPGCVEVTYNGCSKVLGLSKEVGAFKRKIYKAFSFVAEDVDIMAIDSKLEVIEDEDLGLVEGKKGNMFV